MLLEKQLQEEQVDPFNDPELVPKNLQKQHNDADLRASGQGSYAQAFQQKKLEKIQIELHKQSVQSSLRKSQNHVEQTQGDK